MGQTHIHLGVGGPLRELDGTGIYVNGFLVAEPITVSGNTVYDNTRTGIDANYEDVLVVGNTVYGHDGTGDTGINVFGAEVRQNIVYGNYNGIEATGSSLVIDNRAYDNEFGIRLTNDAIVRGNQVYSNSTGIVRVAAVWGQGQIENNLVYANTNQGIVLPGSTLDSQVVGNTVYQEVGDAIRVENGSQDVVLRNNILWVESRYAIHVTADSLQGFDSNYNLIHQGADPNAHYGNFGGTIHDTLFEWQSATGLGANSLEGTPLFVDPNGADNVFGFDASGAGLDGGADDNFQLAAGSPGIDRADSWAASRLDFTGLARVDDPGTPNLGSNTYFEYDQGSSSFAPSGTAQNFHDDNNYRTLDFTTLANPAFSFDFYGVNYTAVHVSSNGFLQFGSTSGIFDDSNSLEELTKYARIAPLWDDLSTSGAKDIYVDDSLADRLTIRWDATNQVDGSDVNVAVSLFDSGRIEFHYGPGNTNLTPTIGISRGDSRNFALSSLDGSASLTDTNSNALVLEPGVGDIGAYEFSGSSLDSTAPVIVGTNPIGIEGGQFLPSLHGSLTVTFSEAVNVIDAVAQSNYELRWAGADDLFGTGDDVLSDLLPSYTAGSVTVSLDVVGGALPDGFYRFTIKSNVGAGTGIHDLAGILLDGDGDSSEGGDYVRTFAVGLTPASFDGDGDVDGDDFLAWQTGFGTTSGAQPSDGDADLDGDVDGDDFLLWQSNFGSSAGAGAGSLATPENGPRHFSHASRTARGVVFERGWAKNIGFATAAPRAARNSALLGSEPTSVAEVFQPLKPIFQATNVRSAVANARLAETRLATSAVDKALGELFDEPTKHAGVRDR